MFLRKDVKPFAKKVWLASPIMHGDELKWMSDAILLKFVNYWCKRLWC